MTMDDFEYGTPMEETAAPSEGPPETLSDSPEPGEDGNGVPGEDAVSEPVENDTGQEGAEPEPPPEEPPKKKRASRKKADKQEESPAEENAAGEDGVPPSTEDAPPGEGLSEADHLDPESGDGSSDTLDVMGLAAQAEAGPPVDMIQEAEGTDSVAGKPSTGLEDTPVGQSNVPEPPSQAHPGRGSEGRQRATAPSCR